MIRKLFNYLLFIMMLFGIVGLSACGTDDRALDEQREPVLPELVDDEEDEVEEEDAPIPNPIVYEGHGDDVISIESPEEGPVVLFIKGNEEGRHFAVKGYDDNDNATELFVNTSDPYAGTTLDDSGKTTVLEISAVGPWTIESQSIRGMRSLESPGTIEGTGDEVLLVEGETNLIEVKGNEEERHFALKGYGDSGSYLIVNTTDVYEGKNRMESGTSVLEVNAVGDWSITIE